MLLAARDGQTAQFTELAGRHAVLTASSSEDVTDRDRAFAALRLYGAREAIEEIEAALARMDDGGYGACQTCGRPIPFERLEATPLARFCAGCAAPPPSPSTGPQGCSGAHVADHRLEVGTKTAGTSSPAGGTER
jgi:RNA polymerase-binding transcription factor DksA